MDNEFAREVGARLRAVRLQQGLSLYGVEQASQGRWKTAVVGSYERADRAASVQQLAELAEFYRVPLRTLVPDETQLAPMAEPVRRLIVDLQQLAASDRRGLALLRRFVAHIQGERGDYNQQVLTLRDSDLRTLSLLYSRPGDELIASLEDGGILRPEPDGSIPRQRSIPAQRSPR